MDCNAASARPECRWTARDIAVRLLDADEQRIRLELAGNLCRCTGYVGIVKAIQAALTKLKDTSRPSPAARGSGRSVRIRPPSQWIIRELRRLQHAKPSRRSLPRGTRTST